MQHESIDLLSQYLKIDTTNPPGNEVKGTAFFADIFEKEEVDFTVYEPEGVSGKGRCSISARISGSGSEEPLILIAAAEKATNWMQVRAEGPPGHGSVPKPDNALERLIRGLNRLQQMDNPITITETTAEYFKRLAEGWDFLKPYQEDGLEKNLIKCLTESGFADIPQVSAMLRNTVSTNVMAAGGSVNVIPSRAEAKLDVRILPGQDPEAFKAMIEKQLDDDQLTVSFLTSDHALASPFDTPELEAIEAVFRRRFPEAVITPFLVFGSTDSRFFREKGMISYGVCPVLLAMDDIQMVHGIDEKISEENMILGTEIYTEIVEKLCAL